MSRDPDAFHVGQTVQTPNGLGIIRRRLNSGPIVKWIVNDCPWRESELSPVTCAMPTGISPACKRGAHNTCGTGYIDAGLPTKCVCACGHPEGRARGVGD